MSKVQQNLAEVPMDPHRLARHYITNYCTNPLKQKTLRFWRGEFWHYEEGRYQLLTRTEMSAMLTRAIKNQEAR
jgi:hypothetical protein